jgi:MFS transporter, UMF1 family
MGHGSGRDSFGGAVYSARIGRGHQPPAGHRSTSGLTAFPAPPNCQRPMSQSPAPTLSGERPVARRAVFGWVTYDLANTIFSMGVVSLFLPLWIREAAGADQADTLWGIIGAISYAIIFVLSPLLGSMTDRARRGRMPFLIVSTLICVGFTMLLGRGDLWVTAVFFIIANIAYNAGLQFYDALLPEVSTEKNRGKIGGIGIGVGYLGSFLAVGLGLTLGTGDKPLLFLLIGLLFLSLALPCFLFVRERRNPNPRPVFGWKVVRESTRETVTALKNGKQFPGLRRFLIGRVIYTDAINTVILIMALYTVNVAVASGLSEEQGEHTAQLILMFAIVFAIFGGFVWGWAVDRLGPKKTLDLVLFSWMVVFLMAAAVGILGLPLRVLYAVAAGAGVALGGVWASDRVYMLRLTPPHRIGEFYGLYGMVGRFSAITGPATWAVILYFTRNSLGLAPQVGQGVGVLVLLVQVVVSYWILRKVDDLPRNWAELSGPPDVPLRPSETLPTAP